VAETTVKRLLSCMFRRICEAMGQVYQYWWRICRELNFFPGSNITRFTFYIHYDVFADSPSLSKVVSLCLKMHQSMKTGW
jgi:hypothetical protein